MKKSAEILNNIVILGDFNLREYEGNVGETNIEGKIYKQLFEEELFMNQFVTEPTRHNSILDLVFSDNHELVKELTVTEGLGNSDHNMVKFKITSETRAKDNYQMVPNFYQADFDSLRNELAQIDWSDKLED